MSFLDALRTVIAKYADFEGRAGRAEFWWWMLFIALGHAAFGVFSVIPVGVEGASLGSILTGLWTIATLLLTSSIAMLTGAIYQRWRTTGLLASLTGLFGVLGLSAIVITWASWWPAIGSWFADASRVVPMALLPLALAIACIAGAWVTLRRATP